MVNGILLAAMLCAGASLVCAPMSAVLADDAATSASASPSLDVNDQPASDEDLKKESGSAVQSVAGNSSSNGMLLPNGDPAVGVSPSLGNAGTSTISTNSSLTSISTLSATVSSNGLQ